MKTLPLLLSLVALGLVAGSGCSKKKESASHAGHHHHEAPHGGSLIEIGDHQFNLELVHDAASGTLTAYVLDAHAENFIRLPIPAIAMIATPPGGAPQPLALKAVANPATGETAGDTSQFSAQADWLKTAKRFEGYVALLEIRGAKFTELKFSFPAEHHHH